LCLAACKHAEHRNNTEEHGGVVETKLKDGPRLISSRDHIVRIPLPTNAAYLANFALGAMW
jgi:hypothetical protein